MTVLLGVIALFALLTLGMAVFQAMAIVRLSPASNRLGNYFLLGWWKFNRIEAQIGPDAAPHLNIYKRAVIAFVVFIVLGVMLSGWAINAQRPAQSAAAEPILITDPRVIPARFAQSFPIPADLVTIALEPAQES